MKIYALLIIMLLAISGCTTTYKGSIKGTSDQGDSRRVNDVATQSVDTQAKP
jgi:hypothetical protein